MRLLFPLALVLAQLTLTSCSPADQPASAVEPDIAVPAAPVLPADPANEPALVAAIASILGEDAASTRMAVELAGQGEGQVALVFLVGMNWCGTGGCNLLILHQTPAGWNQVGNVSRVSNPVRVLTTSTNGLPDIGVTVAGGGGPAPYEAKLAFNGTTYPRFPSDEPLVGVEGTVLITDSDIPPLE